MQNEDQAVSLRAPGNPGRVQQGGNKTRHTFLKRSLGHLVRGTRGKRQGPGETAAASRRMGPAPGLSSPPSGLTSGLAEEVLGS